MSRTHKIRGLFDDNVKTFLESISLYDSLIEGNIKCHFCDEIISLDSFRCVFPYEKEIKFCCDKIECFQLVLKYLEEIK